MTGVAVNVSLALKKVHVGIAVEGAIEGFVNPARRHISYEVPQTRVGSADVNFPDGVARFCRSTP